MKKVMSISPRTTNLAKGKYKILDINYGEIDEYINKKFSAVADIWDSMNLESRGIIMSYFADEGIIAFEDSKKVSKLDWKYMPIEFKLLIIGLELDIDLNPDLPDSYKIMRLMNYYSKNPITTVEQLDDFLRALANIETGDISVVLCEVLDMDVCADDDLYIEFMERVLSDTTYLISKDFEFSKEDFDKVNKYIKKEIKDSITSNRKMKKV